MLRQRSSGAIFSACRRSRLLNCPLHGVTASGFLIQLKQRFLLKVLAECGMQLSQVEFYLSRMWTSGNHSDDWHSQFMPRPIRFPIPRWMNTFGSADPSSMCCEGSTDWSLWGPESTAYIYRPGTANPG